MSPETALLAVVDCWRSSEVKGLELGGLSAEEARALVRPAMTYARRLVFVQHLQQAPLSSENPHEEEMWELFPSPLSNQVVAAIVTGMRTAGTLEPAIAAFDALSEPGGR